jgi:PAS domain S-box-containing protein
MADGSLMWIEYSMHPICGKEGEIEYLVAEGRDITKRRQAEEMLRESEERYRALVVLGGQIGEAIIMLQDEGEREAVHVFCNNVWPRITGYSEGELLNMSFFELVHPKDRQASLRRHRSEMRRESIPGLFEATITRKDGSEVPVEFTMGWSTYQGKPVNVAYIRDISERKRMEEQLRASLKEKEVLLMELHHRVKNNLQVISSLLNLQSGYTTDQRALELFKAARDRIRAMASVHEQLYRSSDLARIDFGRYVREMAEHLICSYATVPDAITLEVEVEDVSLDANTAIPCGLIINELVTNSLKHAFPEGSKGKIWISLSAQENKEFLLIVGDNGIGSPQDLDSKSTHSLGLQLVASLVGQLRGTLDMDRQRGTEWRIRFTPSA